MKSQHKITQIKRIFMITTVRKLVQGDDLGTVSRLIYETDNYIFPHFFGDSKTSAKEILPYMIESNTLYNMDNIYVALIDDKIVGITVVAKSPVKIDVGAFFEAFENAGAMIDDNFERVLKEYFFPLENESEGYYISNICIDEAYRGQGIGGEMLDSILPMLDYSQDVYLDCLSDNQVALAMYKSHGFEELFGFSGFTGLPYYKLIRRANRETIVQQTIEQNEGTQS